MKIALEQGEELDAIFGPAYGEDGECSGGAVGFDGVTKIVVSQLNGPMGAYDVAVIFHGAQQDILPLHMAEIIRTMRGKHG